MAKVFALFPDVDATLHAVEALLGERFQDAEIDVLSSIPLPPAALGLHERETFPQAVLSVGMGALGTLLGFLLAGGTAWLYPLPTGGKPIIAMPTVGVIMYEMTMLCAIWTAFFGTLLFFRGWQTQHLPFDPRVANGAIALVIAPADQARLADAERLLAGALEVRRCA